MRRSSSAAAVGTAFAILGLPLTALSGATALPATQIDAAMLAIAPESADFSASSLDLRMPTSDETAAADYLPLPLVGTAFAASPIADHALDIAQQSGVADCVALLSGSELSPLAVAPVDAVSPAPVIAALAVSTSQETEVAATPPTLEAPSDELPTGETLEGEETPGEEIPSEDAPAEDELPVEDVPAEQIPSDEGPTEESPADETPAETPTEEVPTEEVPTDGTPEQEVPAEEVPIDETPTDEVPTDEVPTEETPADEVPVEEVPTDDVPAEEIPAVDVPADDFPVAEAPAVVTAPIEQPAPESLQSADAPVTIAAPAVVADQTPTPRTSTLPAPPLAVTDEIAVVETSDQSLETYAVAPETKSAELAAGVAADNGWSAVFTDAAVAFFVALLVLTVVALRRRFRRA